MKICYIMHMNKMYELLQKSIENQDITALQDVASLIYTELIFNNLINLGLSEYEYSPAIAVEELGLDEELINELIEDYVSQIMRSLVQFESKLQKLYFSKNNQITLDYSSFRELAHKNLGVARNLRIGNAEILLHELMTKMDLEYLRACLEALEVSAIKLHPTRALKTLKLMQVKNIFKD